MTEPERPLGIGLVGAGAFGARHARALARAGGCRLVAACRGDAEALARFTASHGGVGHRRVEDLLADPAVEAVVVATPHHLHEAHAVAAAAAGRHVLVEKPMAPTVAGCDRIVAAARAARVVLFVGHTLRFAAPLAAAKALLSRGELGAVRFARAALFRPWMDPGRKPWHLDPDSGGGMLLTAGIHPLDAVLWLVAEPVTGVHAAVGTRFHAMDVDDVALITLRFRGGAIGSVASLGFRDGALVGGIELVCDHGVLSIDPARGLRIGRGGAWRDAEVALPAAVMDEALTEEWRAFRRAVRDGEPPAVDGTAGRAAVACIAAAFESARRRCEVAPDP